MSDPLSLAVVLTGLIAMNGVYVAAEFALIAVRPTRVAHLAAAGHASAITFERFLHDREMQARYLATTQMGISVASLALGMWGERQIADRLSPLLSSLGRWSQAGAHGIAIVGAIVLLTYLHVVLGEMLPKSVTLRHPERVAFGVARLMSTSQLLFRPAVALFIACSNALLRALGIRPGAPAERTLSPGELAAVIGESASGGLIQEREQQILLRVFDFAERQAREIMTPREKVVAFPIAIAEEELAGALASSSHTRFPVYDGDLDAIVGTLHLKDFVRWQIGRKSAYDLRRLLRPARLVEEHVPARALLETFRRDRAHLAVVIDEKGVTAGLVTLEDVAEELVGELRDEFD